MAEEALNRAFLDTNIVWNIQTYCEEIFDGVDFDKKNIVSEFGAEFLQDLESLREICAIAQRYGSIEFVTAWETIDELARKINDPRAEARVNWAYELLDWWIQEVQINHSDEDFTPFRERAIEILAKRRLDFLSDSEDRLLIACAVAANCHLFLTMDYKTILSERKRIEKTVPLVIRNPTEYWKYVGSHI